MRSGGSWFSRFRRKGNDSGAAGMLPCDESHPETSFVLFRQEFSESLFIFDGSGLWSSQVCAGTLSDHYFQ